MRKNGEACTFASPGLGTADKTFSIPANAHFSSLLDFSAKLWHQPDGYNYRD